MSEVTKSLVLAGAFVAFILAAYMQEGGSWRGPHSLRKSLHPKGATVECSKTVTDATGCYVFDGDGRVQSVALRKREMRPASPSL